MPWQCKLVELGKNGLTARDLKPGDMYYVPRILEDEQLKPIRDMLSPEYMRDWYGKRPPIYLILPNGHAWGIDFKFTGRENGWVITGEAPNLTAMPSINSLSVHGYHGWLKDGILTDDLEGRTYPKRGD